MVGNCFECWPVITNAACYGDFRERLPLRFLTCSFPNAENKTTFVKLCGICFTPPQFRPISPCAHQNKGKRWNPYSRTSIAYLPTEIEKALRMRTAPWDRWSSSKRLRRREKNKQRTKRSVNRAWFCYVGKERTMRQKERDSADDLVHPLLLILLRDNINKGLILRIKVEIALSEVRDRDTRDWKGFQSRLDTLFVRPEE